MGFSSIKEGYYIDHLYVGAAHQQQGVASKLLAHTEAEIINNKASKIASDVSITALAFFKAKGYNVLKQNQIKHKGAVLINYDVTKTLIENS